MVQPGASRLALNILMEEHAQHSHRRLAVLIPDKYFPLSNAPFQQRLAQEVTLAGQAADYAVTTLPIPSVDQSRFAHTVMRKFNAAFVIEMQTHDIPMLFTLTERQFPVLLFNRHVPGLPAPSLNTDDYGAAQHLARLLVEHGHRNVCMHAAACYDAVMGQHSATDGWVCALKQLGVLDDCILPIVYGKQNLMALDRLLRLRPQITGIVWSGRLPLDFEGILSARGIKLGQDLSIAAVGSNSGGVGSTNSQITSFEIDWKRAGQCAIEMTGRMLTGESHPKDIRVALNINLTNSIGNPSTIPAAMPTAPTQG